MKRLLQIAATVAAAGIGWGLVERRWFVLRHQTLPVLGGADASTLRLLHLSDLHLVPGDRGMARFLRRALAYGPDMVVVTGDMLGHPDAIDDAVDLLGAIRADRPAIAVLGSNDRFGPVLRNPLRYLAGPTRRHTGAQLDTERLVVGLKEAGWHVLRNERVTVPSATGDIDVIGLDDPHIGADSPEQIDWTPPDPPAPLRLGVVHSPYVDVLDRFAEEGIDLTLAGHTHGGQVRVPFVGALVDNCDLPLDMARGPSAYTDRMWLHVSAGLGTSRYAPVRFACRPEASIVDLIPRRAEPAAL
jgi:predicted MPP superfamily phosphohydrolase